MDGGARGPSEGAEELVTSVKDNGTGGRQTTGIGDFFKAVVQTVLLFGSETWVMIPLVGRSLGIFQHRFTRQVKGRNPKRRVDGIWYYPLL